MRRYSVTEAPLRILLNELDELVRRDEHLNPDKPDRIEAYKRAWMELEMGAPRAQARRTVFIVNEESTSRYGVCEGSREELLAELERYRADRAQAGKAGKALAIAETALRLEQGAEEVRVDRVVYRVVED